MYSFEIETKDKYNKSLFASLAEAHKHADL
jgi:hypothetical protein